MHLSNLISYLMASLAIIYINSKEVFGPLNEYDHLLIEKGIDKLTKVFKMKELLYSNSSFASSDKFLEEDNLVKAHPQNETVMCKICEFTFTNVHNFLKKKYGFNWISRFVIWLCSWGVKYEVCEGAISLWENKVIDSIIDRYLDHEYICSSRFVCKDAHYVELNPDDYAKKLLEDKPNRTQIEEYHKRNSKNLNKTYKVLHITDLHTDFKYEEVRSLFIVGVQRKLWRFHVL